MRVVLVVALLALSVGKAATRLNDGVMSSAGFSLRSARLYRHKSGAGMLVPVALVEVHFDEVAREGEPVDPSEVSVVCGGREMPKIGVDELDQAIVSDPRFLVNGPKLIDARARLTRESPFAFSTVQDHPRASGFKAVAPAEDRNHTAWSTTTSASMLIPLDIRAHDVTPHDRDFYLGYLQQCSAVLPSRNHSGIRASTPLRRISSHCGAQDWMGALGHVRLLANQALRIVRAQQPQASAAVGFLEEASRTRSRTASAAGRLPRAFTHDISESMRVNTADKTEALSFMLCKSNMTTSLRNHHIHRDIGVAAQGWLPGFIVSALRPIGRAIVKILFTIVPVIGYIIKGMAQALVDLMTFSVVGTLGDIVIGPEMGVIETAMVQEITFGTVPVISYMITGHMTVRITKGTIPDIAQALSTYLRKECIPTVASMASHTLVSFVSEALSIQLPRRITKALSFTLSHSLTHVVPKYYYCQYCMEKNEYCGQCYGYWRGVRANRGWWKRAESTPERDRGARDVVVEPRMP